MRLAAGGHILACSPGSVRARRLILIGLALAMLCPVRAAAASATAQPGGVILDGWGGLHTFGGAAVTTSGAPYWPGWDIARAVAVRADGTGGWTLDGYGGIHNWGAAAPVATPFYWGGWDIVRDMVMTSPDGSHGYLLDGLGGIHAWGTAQPQFNGPYPGTDQARSLLIEYDTGGTPDGGWTLYADGTLHAFGAAAAPGKPAPVTLSGKPLWTKIRGTVSSTVNAGYLVGHWGTVQTWGGLQPYWSGYGDWGTWDIERDVALLRADNQQPSPQPQSAGASTIFAAAGKPAGGATLDAFGGVHPFGDVSINTTAAPYWNGWDIARAVQLREDGSGGWTLDGWGAIHRWGTQPGLTVPAAWPGMDTAAVSFVVTSHDANGVADGASGYLLDEYGAVHPWGGAPQIGDPPYMLGFGIYRGLAIHTNAQGTPDGGWAMDEVGRTYAFGGAAAMGDATPYGGRPMFTAMHRTQFGWYSVARDGEVAAFGGGYMQPSWTGWADWNGWNIVRDVSLINPVDTLAPAQPLSAGAAQDFTNEVNGLYMLDVPLARQTHPLDCEAGTMQMVLAARGTQVNQDWELHFWGADLRPAVFDAAGNILRWGDPYTSFVGNVDASEWNAGGYGIYYPPLVRLAQYLGHQAIGKEQWTVNQLFDLVVSGYPAAVEGSYNMQLASPRTYTAWDGRTVQYILNNHVFVLIGVDFGRQTVLINDPATGTRKQFSWSDFARSFTYINNMATVVS
ncbi:MAG TPA: C39 family peptidase [Candidatus Dormibacteraeota bacterium]|nr:C39 family peptidase [Candidatus Dormibacteraeota bacterium]